METNLLDRMLQTYLTDQTPITITLQNKIRVSGKIKAFDSYIIVVEDRKREILYRHAVSCIMAAAQAEQRRVTAGTGMPAAKSAVKHAKDSVHKMKPSPLPQAVLSAPSGETSINSSMKDGLLKWMQEQKAAK